jgi:diaminopimelate epimerase
MSLRFIKLHGLGNDYVYVDVFEQSVRRPEELARRISDRHRGVGGDGLILIAPPQEPDAHVRMIMFNADGSRGQMCGNGIRCVAKYAYDHGRARHDPLRVQTDAGVLTLNLTLDPDGRVERVRVDMGPPILDPKRIPVALGGERVVAAPVPLPDRVLTMTCVSLGNPHVVIFQEDVRRTPVEQLGPLLERHPLFPQRVNVHFAQVRSRDRVQMRTWERGTGRTQACGTGACAVCVAGVLNGLTDRSIVAEMPGGELQAEWNEATGHVLMTGPAVEVFRGEWPEDG